jgi:hypothetical protein
MEDSSIGMPRLLLVPGPVAGAVRLRAAREVSPTSSVDDFQWESRQRQRLAATRRAGQRLAATRRDSDSQSGVDSTETAVIPTLWGLFNGVRSLQLMRVSTDKSMGPGAGSVHYTRLSRPRRKERQQRKEREAIKAVKRGAGHARNEATD